jgi:DNA-binding response OmpR family regulator
LPTCQTLIIDDEEDVRALLEYMLEQQKFRVRTVEDGERGLEILRRQDDETDVVVLDISMPGRGGFETLEKMQNLEDPPLTMILSSTSTEEYQVRAFENGAVDYITKPFSPAVLVARMKRHLEREMEGEPEPMPDPWVSALDKSNS